MPQDPPIIYKTIRPLREGLVSIPAGRLDLIPEDYEIIDKRVQAPTQLPEFRYELRANQRVVHDEVDDCAIINAWVSWGKTFTALAIAQKLGQKTLVVTHTTNLRNQWEKEVQKCFGIQPGRIGSGDFNTSSPIVIGNIQSLYRTYRGDKTFIRDSYFGRNASCFKPDVYSNNRRNACEVQDRLDRDSGEKGR